MRFGFRSASVAAMIAGYMSRSLGKTDRQMREADPEMAALIRKQEARAASYHKPDHTRVKGHRFPQHGKRECARRVRQMKRAEFKRTGPRVTIRLDEINADNIRAAFGNVPTGGFVAAEVERQVLVFQTPAGVVMKVSS